MSFLSYEPRSDRVEIKPAELGRAIRRFMGAVFALVAIGLWLVPGSNWAADVALIKTGLTAVLCITSAAFILSGRKGDAS